MPIRKVQDIKGFLTSAIRECQLMSTVVNEKVTRGAVRITFGGILHARLLAPFNLIFF